MGKHLLLVLSPTSWLVLTSVLAGCDSDRNNPPPAATGEAGGSDEGKGDSQGKSDELEPPTPGECAQLCGARTEHAVDGWCYPALECEADCEAGLGSGASADAFATCVNEDPLCFRTIGDCIGGEAPEPDVCAELCSARTEHEVDGWCYPALECEADCEAGLGSGATAEAFATCVNEDPLCFRTIGDCIGGEAPEPDACTELCSARTEHAVDGWCYPATDCEADCRGELGTGPNADAFAACVNEDPLCFRTVADCIGGATPTFDCVATCEVRADDGPCFNSAECEAFCTEHVGDWGDTEREAFVVCMNDDPLCFRAPQDCIDEHLR